MICFCSPAYKGREIPQQSAQCCSATTHKEKSLSRYPALPQILYTAYWKHSRSWHVALSQIFLTCSEMFIFRDLWAAWETWHLCLKTPAFQYCSYYTFFLMHSCHSKHCFTHCSNFHLVLQTPFLLPQHIICDFPPLWPFTLCSIMALHLFLSMFSWMFSHHFKLCTFCAKLNLFLVEGCCSSLLCQQQLL